MERHCRKSSINREGERRDKNIYLHTSVQLTLDLTFDALYADGVILPNGLLVGTWTNKGEYIDANDGVVGQLMRLNSSSFKWTK